MPLPVPRRLKRPGACSLAPPICHLQGPWHLEGSALVLSGKEPSFKNGASLSSLVSESACYGVDDPTLKLDTGLQTGPVGEWVGENTKDRPPAATLELDTNFLPLHDHGAVQLPGGQGRCSPGHPAVPGQGVLLQTG